MADKEKKSCDSSSSHDQNKTEEEDEDLMALYGSDSGWVEARTHCDHLEILSSDLIHIPAPDTPCNRCFNMLLILMFFFEEQMDNPWFTKLTNQGFAFIAIVISFLVNTDSDTLNNHQTVGYMRYLSKVAFVSFLTAKLKLGLRSEAFDMWIGLLMIDVFVIITLLPKDLVSAPVWSKPITVA